MLCKFWFQDIWNEDTTFQLHCKDKKQPNKYQNKKVGDSNSVSSFAKIFDIDNKEVKGTPNY